MLFCEVITKYEFYDGKGDQALVESQMMVSLRSVIRIYRIVKIVKYIIV